MGIGHYQIDLHSSSERNNYINFPALPFELPLGSLIPERLNNIIAAAKNIGTTHVTNDCYRLHPVEWNIGEAAGYLAATSIKKNHTQSYQEQGIFFEFFPTKNPERRHRIKRPEKALN